LSRFVIERLLFRLSVSPHAGSFVLKGALLFSLWYDTPHRPTKDADLLGFGADDADTLRATFSAVCAIDADDGARYDTSNMKITPIREDNVYGGMRLSLLAFVGSARLPVQVDIGFGDAITPAPELVTYPTLLDGMDAPRLRAYPVYKVIAEKFHAMVELGINNSRMKDFFDLAVIARTSALEGGLLVEALRATFARRGKPCAVEPHDKLGPVHLDTTQHADMPTFTHADHAVSATFGTCKRCVTASSPHCWPPRCCSSAAVPCVCQVATAPPSLRRRLRRWPHQRRSLHPRAYPHLHLFRRRQRRPMRCRGSSASPAARRTRLTRSTASATRPSTPTWRWCRAASRPGTANRSTAGAPPAARCMTCTP
jgi:Nucleotidyl transferase AbiEii toxin, Type IV TA system